MLPELLQRAEISRFFPFHLCSPLNIHPWCCKCFGIFTLIMRKVDDKYKYFNIFALTVASGANYLSWGVHCETITLSPLFLDVEYSHSMGRICVLAPSVLPMINSSYLMNWGHLPFLLFFLYPTWIWNLPWSADGATYCYWKQWTCDTFYSYSEAEYMLEYTHCVYSAWNFRKSSVRRKSKLFRVLIIIKMLGLGS